ncbi:hypothetical protein [Tateyamaria sp. SN6-1]|uniref:hypothetical protein n=1 Tax=Tateyamaria sp. SN6-1 TaxID=3092148 RepID=UPI0039F5DB45
MIVYVKATLLAFSVTIPGYAMAQRAPADAARWMIGCIDLVQEDSAAAGEMDAHCVTNAADYCAIGRQAPDRLPCFDALSATLDRRLAVLIAQKPDISNLTGFGPGTFERQWAQATEQAIDCPGSLRPKDMCSLFISMQRWTAARTAWRIWRRYQT